MLKNYFKIAWRNLLKNKIYNTINIAGLSVALASFIVVLLYMNYELSYDSWDPTLKRVFKVSVRTDEEMLDQTPAPLAELLRNNSPIIEAATKMQPSGDFDVPLSAGEKKIYQKGGVEADSLFFKVFPHKFLAGNSASALTKPNAIVLSKKLAEKLFGQTDPIGKTVTLFGRIQNEITGIIDEPNGPTNINTQFVYRSPYEKGNQNWENFSYETYVKTKRFIKTEQLEKALDELYYNQRLKKDNKTYGNFRKTHQAGIFADAIRDLHNFPKHGASNFSTVTILLVLSLLLLFAGAINFSNLSVAVSIRRAKEVGVRKVMGSTKAQLVWQFMSETTLQCIVCLLAAIVLVQLITPYFNIQFNTKLDLFASSDLVSISVQILLCLSLVILISGLYPAIFLSLYNTTQVLKGSYSKGVRGLLFRNSMIVAQFVVSVFFIAESLMISHQIHYMKTKDKGFSGEQVMRIEAMQKTREEGFNTLRSTFLQIPGVQYVSKVTSVPGDLIPDTSSFSFKSNGKQFRLVSVKVSDDYFKTLKIQIVKGRSFNSGYADQHTRSAIINETAARLLKFNHEPFGTVTFNWCDSVPIQVVGIVKDFNVINFENKIQPVVFTIGNEACMYQSGGGILVKINSNHMQNTIAEIEKSWKKIEPDMPIRYSFLDENFQQLFSSYLSLQKIINFFAFTAIAISAMGLFALTAFLTGQRMKEISIRKILGADLRQLSTLLSRDFVVLVLIAVAIGLPVSFWAANRWLQRFAYHSEPAWWIFGASAVAVIAAAVATISFQTIKAALANPVKNLRTE